MAQFIVAANWKLNKSPDEAEHFFEEFVSQVSEEEQKHFIIFPPAIDLLIAQKYLSSTHIGWGAQNVYSEESGAFTGENSAAILKAMGASDILVGHSERRTLFNESDELIAAKFKTIQELELSPMLCVGESLHERESGQTKNVITEQLKAALIHADTDKPFILAYEPVWAIGTGKVATPAQAEEAHLVLRNCLKSIAGEDVANSTSILYGGSVKATNAAELSSQANINGFLVGGASLEVDSFISIFRNSVQ